MRIMADALILSGFFLSKLTSFIEYIKVCWGGLTEEIKLMIFFLD